MANNQDARPFVDLQRDAEEFRTKFDEDISECIEFLDSKITALICDPDSVSSVARSVKQNALVEFSKSKYDIFISMKSLMNRKEREWIEYISEMKKLFIENVEIFLAGTKLEVKLPSSEFESSPGPRKSPGNRKSTSMTSSLYPILSNITKNIPGLGSPLQAKEVSKVEEKVQFNRGIRSSTKLDKPSSAFAAYKEVTDSSGSSQSETETDRNVQTSIKGRLSATALKLANSSFQDQFYDSVMDTDEPGFELNTSKSGSRKSRKSGQLDNSGLDNSPLNRSRRSSSKIELNAGTSLGLDNSPLNRSRRSSSKIELNSGTSLALPEEIVPTARSKSAAASRSASTRRGRQPTQTTKLVNETPQKYSKAEINEDTTITKVANVQNQRSVKSSGRQSKKPADVSKCTSSSEEMDNAKTVETSVKPVKGRKGKQGAKAKVANTSEKENIEETTNDVIVAESNVETVTIKTRRGRSAASNTETSVLVDEVPVKKSIRGRKSVKAVVESYGSVPSHSKSNLTSSDEHVEPEPDVIPATRPTKAAGRRKTMLPNWEDIAVPEQFSGNATRARSKRKTICDFAELNAATSSKRLKSASGSVLSVQADEDAADNNLLERDDNYSDWMALKSLDGRIPTNPGVYEVKVWRAKKSAYIGFCESLRQKFTLYKLRQNSGHKHLDKFVDRNYDDIQIRFETVPSVDIAKQEVKKRISSFTAQHKTTPAYN